VHQEQLTPLLLIRILIVEGMLSYLHLLLNTLVPLALGLLSHLDLPLEHRQLLLPATVLELDVLALKSR
jgi:hypothetical protein